MSNCIGLQNNIKFDYDKKKYKIISVKKTGPSPHLDTFVLILENHLHNKGDKKS